MCAVHVSFMLYNAMSFSAVWLPLPLRWVVRISNQRRFTQALWVPVSGTQDDPFDPKQNHHQCVRYIFAEQWTPPYFFVSFLRVSFSLHVPSDPCVQVSLDCEVAQLLKKRLDRLQCQAVLRSDEGLEFRDSGDESDDSALGTLIHGRQSNKA